MDLHPLNIPHSCHDEIQLDQQHQLPTGPHRVRGKRRGVPPCYDPWWFRMVISLFFFCIQIHGGFPWWFSRDPITWKRELMGFDHQGIHRVPVKNWDLVIKTRDKSGTDVSHYYSTAITCCTMQCFRRSLPFDNNNMNKSTANKRDYVTRLGMYTSWGCKCTYYMDLNG